MAWSFARAPVTGAHRLRRSLGRFLGSPLVAAVALGVLVTQLGACAVSPSWEEGAGAWSSDRTGWTRGNRGGGDR